MTMLISAVHLFEVFPIQVALLKLASCMKMKEISLPGESNPRLQRDMWGH